MATKKAKKSPGIEAQIAAATADAKQRRPSMPVDVLLLEGAQVAKAGKAIRAKLVKLPSFQIVHLDGLPGLLDALRDAEAAWGNLRMSVAAGRGKTNARAQAEALRGDLLASADYLFRANREATAELARIREGEGVADLVADLQDLAGFWGRNKKVWAVDETLDDATFKRAMQLADTLAAVEDAEAGAAAMERRNVLAGLVEAALAELRDAAAFLLRKDPRRLAPFLSRFEAVRRAQSRRKANKAAKANPGV
jgi:hypothetical protein